MDTDKFYTIFNTKITEFLNDLIRLFPDDADLRCTKLRLV